MSWLVKLFSLTALLKWKVVKHLWIGDENWVKDYFEYFCEKDPIMKLKKINARFLKWWKNILAYSEYLFKLSNSKQEVPANFTMVFEKKIESVW